jgi:hypothetical protein
MLLTPNPTAVVSFWKRISVAVLSRPQSKISTLLEEGVELVRKVNRRWNDGSLG